MDGVLAGNNVRNGGALGLSGGLLGRHFYCFDCQYHGRGWTKVCVGRYMTKRNLSVRKGLCVGAKCCNWEALSYLRIVSSRSGVEEVVEVCFPISAKSLCVGQARILVGGE